MNLTCTEVAATALGGPARKQGAEILYRCPCHDDRNPSLSINKEKNCWLCGPCGKSGNAWELAAFLAGLDPNDKPGITDWLREHGLLNGTDDRKKIIATYDYTDTDDKLHYQKVRYEPKDFRLRRPDGKCGWVYNLKGVKPVLYNLPEMSKAKSVLLVEGEKDVETARKLGLVATTSGGTGSWRLEFAEMFHGKRVAIIADADEPGRRHAREGARSLVDFAESARLLEMPGAKDLTEWVEKGGTKEKLVELVKATPILTAADTAVWKVQENGKATEGFRLVSLHDLFLEPEEKVSYIVQDRLPAGGFSILAGKPKAGKSTLARCLALAVARGEPFLGWVTAQGPVIYLALEEKRSEVRAHFRAMGAGGDEPIFTHAAQAPQDGVLALEEIVNEHKPALIIVDPLLKLARVRSEKEYAEVSAALEPLLNLARESGAHLLAVYHSPKADRADLIDSILGTTAFGAAVDTLLVLKRTKEYRTLATVQRYGSDLPETVLEFDSERRTTSLGAEKGEAEQERIGEAILEYLSGAGEAKPEAEIDKEVEGKTTHKRAALRELVKAAKVGRSGKGKSGDPYRYEVSFSCSPPITGTREQDMGNEGQPTEIKQQCLVPDIAGELQENLISREQDFLHSAEPKWEEGTL